MITAFRISDALRCMLVDAPGDTNMAAPTELIVRCRPLRHSAFWAQSLGRGTNRVTVGDWDGISLSSLASARVRSGIRSWEIDRLHLKESEQGFELLEQAVYSAGCRGAERVFLRVPCDSELVDTARMVGFFPYFKEAHLAGAGAPSNTCLTGFSVEHRTPTDLQGLFQLYNAATPQEVRRGIGMTIDEWMDSQEPVQTGRKELVLKLDGKIVGWRMCESFSKATAGQTLGHPDYPDSTRYLVGISCNTQKWLVPNYQQNVAGLLKRQGLQEVGRYTMLIKTVSVPVRSREFSYVEA